MKNKYFLLLIGLLLAVTTFTSCVKDVENEDEALVFLGAESYFKFYDEVVPAELDTVFNNYISENNRYDYLNLYNVSFIATKMDGNYEFKRNPVEGIEFDDPFSRASQIASAADVRLSGQNNCIISMDIFYDTIVDTETPDNIRYRNYESIVADTLYVVGEVGNTGRFLMYGYADSKIERGYVDDNGDFDMGLTYQKYEYKSVIIMVGDKVEDGIREMLYFEYITDVSESTIGSYPVVGDIRAFSDVLSSFN